MSKVTEYQKSAALMAGDIEMMFSLAEKNPDKALEFFRRLKKMRDDVISNEQVRDSRYSASCKVFGAVNSGMVNVTKVSS
jgi:hypothetical protein